jgi:hypothetical protein
MCSSGYWWISADVSLLPAIYLFRIPARSVTTITTDASGQTAVITLVLTQTASVSVSSAAAAATISKSGDGDSIPKSAIVGISVAVGLVILGLIACAIWRMKRRNGDEDEAIRW